MKTQYKIHPVWPMPISHQIEGNDPSQHLGCLFIIIISSCSTFLDFFCPRKVLQLIQSQRTIF